MTASLSEFEIDMCSFVADELIELDEAACRASFLRCVINCKRHLGILDWVRAVLLRISEPITA